MRGLLEPDPSGEDRANVVDEGVMEVCVGVSVFCDSCRGLDPVHCRSRSGVRCSVLSPLRRAQSCRHHMARRAVQLAGLSVSIRSDSLVVMLYSPYQLCFLLHIIWQLTCEDDEDEEQTARCCEEIWVLQERMQEECGDWLDLGRRG